MKVAATLSTMILLLVLAGGTVAGAFLFNRMDSRIELLEKENRSTKIELATILSVQGDQLKINKLHSSIMEDIVDLISGATRNARAVSRR